MISEIIKAAQSTITGTGNGSFYKVIQKTGISAPFRKDLSDAHKDLVKARKSIES
ncbi:MAG: hypothetical protein Nk1A_8340 [Endomicrobiia bacterium]|nr:MAG: hypothetical protein Nk1A_8340 [Endomicrobiia bacterium]